MFNRTIETRIVKKNKNKDEEVSDRPVIDVQSYADIAGKNVVKLLVAYFALQTARQVVVNRLSK